MDKNLKNKLIEEMKRFNELKDEPYFSAEEFTKEISLLLSYYFSDFFRGEFKFDGKNIICKFDNGQIFTVETKEIKRV